MAFADLNTLGGLWDAAGLKYLYFPDGVPEPETARKNAPPTRAPVSPTEAYKGSAAAARRPVGNPTFKTSPSAAAPRPAPANENWTPLTYEQFPPSWQKLLSRSQKGLIAWTYLDLGADLFSGPDAPEAEKIKINARRVFLQNLLKDLNYPRDARVFLPLTPGLWNPADFSADLFWSALRWLGCRGVIVFGSQTGETLLPGERLRPLTAARARNFFVWILRDINVLAAPNSYYRDTLAYLRRLLGSVIKGY